MCIWNLFLALNLVFENNSNLQRPTSCSVGQSTFAASFAFLCPCNIQTLYKHPAYRNNGSFASGVVTWRLQCVCLSYFDRCGEGEFICGIYLAKAINSCRLQFSLLKWHQQQILGTQGGAHVYVGGKKPFILRLMPPSILGTNSRQTGRERLTVLWNAKLLKSQNFLTSKSPRPFDHDAGKELTSCLGSSANLWMTYFSSLERAKEKTRSRTMSGYWSVPKFTQLQHFILVTL